MVLKKDGSLLLYDERKEITNNLYVTTHAKMRLRERRARFDIRDAILHSPVCYWSADGYVICAVDEFRTLVLGAASEGKWAVVTYTEKSKRGYSVAEKWLLTRVNASREVM